MESFVVHSNDDHSIFSGTFLPAASSSSAEWMVFLAVYLPQDVRTGCMGDGSCDSIK